MDNTTYEFFIRRCWDCDRFSHGANTDTWEDLLIKHHNLKNASVGTFKEAEKEFTKKLAQVKAYLDKAFNKLITTAKKKKINPDVADEFEKLRATVGQASDPQLIFNTLRAAFPLMNDNNL